MLNSTTELIVEAIHASMSWINFIVGGLFGLALIGLIISLISNFRTKKLLKQIKHDVVEIKHKVTVMEGRWNSKKK